jgi:hypothetical protein
MDFMPRVKPKRKTVTTRRRKSVLQGKRQSPASQPALHGKELEQAVERFQSEADDKKAHEQWKKIEVSVFGVQFED